MRTRPSALLLALMICSGGCPWISDDRARRAHDPDGDSVPWYDLHEEWGVRLEHPEHCLSFDLQGVQATDDYTVELYLDADASQAEPSGLYPVLIWPGMLALFQQDGALWLGSPEDPGLAVAFPHALVDGGRHHLLLSHSAGSRDALFLDGDYQGLAIPPKGSIEPGELLVGCWPAQGAWFPGVLGELRLQGGATSTTDFEPAWRPLEADEDTIALWRLDEGQGSDLADETGAHPGELLGGSWEHFSLACFDEHLNCGPYPVQIADQDADGHDEQHDCDDDYIGRHPGADETCDGLDNDCDGLIDQDDPSADCIDQVTQ